MNDFTTDSDRRATVSRRQFLVHAGCLTGTLWATSSSLLALAPSPVWALPLANLDERSGRVLSQVTRHIFPHATLDDAVYAFVVRDLDLAAKDATLKTMLVDGIRQLDDGAKGDWLALDKPAQLALVTKLAGSPFFEKVRSTAVVSLYNNELAFAHFGYQGESFSKGGYLERGFNDLTWLPAPPPAASPAA